MISFYMSILLQSRTHAKILIYWALRVLSNALPHVFPCLCHCRSGVGLRFQYHHLKYGVPPAKVQTIYFVNQKRSFGGLFLPSKTCLYTRPLDGILVLFGPYECKTQVEIEIRSLHILYMKYSNVDEPG